MLCHIKNIRAVVRHSTDHFSGLGKAIGSLCVCVCPSNTETFEIYDRCLFGLDFA